MSSILRSLVAGAVVVVAGCVSAASTTQPLTAPGALLIYYGWPSVINGSTTVAGAAAELGRYDLVVLGDGVDKPEHPDHAKTRQILRHPAAAGTTFFGYVDLGVSTQNLKIAAVFAAIEGWQQ